MAIINLQPTQFDAQADVKIHGYVDDIIGEMMNRLKIPIPNYDSSLDFVVSKIELFFPSRILVLPEGRSKTRPFRLPSTAKHQSPAEPVSQTSHLERKRKREDKGIILNQFDDRIDANQRPQKIRKVEATTSPPH
jgi:hypothetical protein